MDHNKLWKILKEMGIPDHLTCLLRNLYEGQETTVRIGHGTTSLVPYRTTGKTIALTRQTFHNKLWKILKEMGIPDHLICLLRNIYAGQEATVRTGHGATD